jgi:phage tail-like protein
MNPPAGYNQCWLFNPANGWRQGYGTKLTGLTSNAAGALTLQTLPGGAEPFAPDLTGQVTCPAALACGECGELFVLDTAAARVFRIDPPGQVQAITYFGGPGSEPRQLRTPRGMTMACGRLVVSDTGNHRIQVFSPPPYALIQLWGRADGTPGDGPHEFRRPWGVAADRWGHVYIADRGNGRVHKIKLDGTWVTHLGVRTLKDPTELAVNSKGVVAVVDGIADASGGTVQLFPPGTAAPVALTKIEQPRAVAFDADDNLYVATAHGLVFHYAPDTQPFRYAYVGAGVTGLDAPAVSMVWGSSLGLLSIFQNANSPGRKLWMIPTTGTYASAVYTVSPPGSCNLLSGPLDGGMTDCPWDRVTLLGTVPDGTSVTVEYFTSNSPDIHPDAPNPTNGPPYTFVGNSAISTCNNPTCGDPACSDPSCEGVADQAMTCLVQSPPGQFIMLRVTLKSDGRFTPALSALKVFFPRQSYLRYLPAVYQQDPDSRDFLDRFLSIFQATFEDFDASIDNMYRLFKADTVPSQFFDWLAAWLQLPTDPSWPMATKRKMLKKYALDDRVRGTSAGILQAIQEYAGLTDGVALVEHFRLRHWPILPAAGPLCGETRLWSPQFYQRLQVGTYSQVGAFVLTDRPEPAAESQDWGANEFSVFFPADPYEPEARTAKVAVVVEREKPAHTRANYVPVLPRFRVGVQATVGVDACVGGYTQLVLGSLSRLGYDAILGCSQEQRDMEKLGTTVPPITGITTRLY